MPSQVGITKHSLTSLLSQTHPDRRPSQKLVRHTAAQSGRNVAAHKRDGLCVLHVLEDVLPLSSAQDWDTADIRSRRTDVAPARDASWYRIHAIFTKQVREPDSS